MEPSIRLIPAKEIKEFDPDVKRFRIPVKFDIKCPKCEAVVLIDLEEDYLPHPTINGKFEASACCGECEEELQFDLTLKMEIEVDDNSVRVY